MKESRQTIQYSFNDDMINSSVIKSSLKETNKENLPVKFLGANIEDYNPEKFSYMEEVSKNFRSMFILNFIQNEDIFILAINKI